MILLYYYLPVLLARNIVLCAHIFLQCIMSFVSIFCKKFYFLFLEKNCASNYFTTRVKMQHVLYCDVCCWCSCSSKRSRITGCPITFFLNRLLLVPQSFVRVIIEKILTQSFVKTYSGNNDSFICKSKVTQSFVRV